MIYEALQSQKKYFSTGETKSIAYRKQLLQELKRELIKREDEIISALYADFNKPPFESIVTETSFVLSELNLTLKKINTWAKPKRITPALLNFPSSDKIYSEPYGNTLIISPWNYPYQLALAPIIAAVAAGNTAIIKPSELTPNTSSLIKSIINAIFKPEHVLVIEGGVAISQALLALKWDYIFFTGSVNIGKIVAQAAAKHLTPVTLELGGKNPCIIDETAPIKLTAKRIVWGKFLNAGQTCIAPDYILIHKTVKEAFYKAVKAEIELAYSENPENSEDFARIINENHFLRLQTLLENETCCIGGTTNLKTNYIAPTVIDEPKLDSAVMKDEIFGPILPVISYSTEEDINSIVLRYNKPLAFYVFSKKNTFAKKMIENNGFGGGAINDTIVHFSNHRLPFGGVANSGIGAYHGKRSFDAFSHKKAVVKKGNWLDLPLRYAPYKGKIKLIKWVLKWI